MIKQLINRIIKTILLTLILFAFAAYIIKEKNSLSTWDEILTVRFWILLILHLIPMYFLAWHSETHYPFFERRLWLFIFIILWGIILGIICAISKYLFDFELIEI